MTMIYRADGYQGFRLFHVRFYKAVIYGLGHRRYSNKKFKRARDAAVYGIRLVERYAHLKAAERTAEMP